MGKYIWPRHLAAASRWYLMLLQESVHGLSLNELMDIVQADAQQRKAIQARLNRLKDAGLIDKVSRQHYTPYVITPNGRQRLALLTFEQLRPIADWDHYWRIVIFDVPESERIARYHIRKLLIELGFFQLQLSVWIHPLPCTDQFDKIRVAYGKTAHLYLIESATFMAPRHIVRHFDRLYPELSIN